MIRLFSNHTKLVLLSSFLISYLYSENNNCELPTQSDLMAHLRFIASDELKGRKPGTNEIKTAARYIAEQFRAYGLKQFSKNDSYLQPVDLTIDGGNVKCNNVIGFIEGIDKSSKNQYIVLVAHYDHLGVIVDSSMVCQDSIYNGARDNGMGVVALLYTAKYFSLYNPQRSILFLASTGEEKGMLGSKYFIDNCPINVENIVFTLNNDGGGYNDVTNVRIGGKELIKFKPDFWSEIEDVGLACPPYPSELSYLYERGDSFTFANEGIPSLTISPGFNEINEELIKYVHQPIDEADDLFDYSYLLEFSKVYSQIVQMIANCDIVPDWKSNVKYKTD